MSIYPKNLRKIFWLTLIVGLLLWLAALPAHAAVSGDASIDWLTLGMGLFGGLALFLAGLEILSEGMKQAAGKTLKHVLSQLTTNRFFGGSDRGLCNGRAQLLIRHHGIGCRLRDCRRNDPGAVGGCHNGSKYRQHDDGPNFSFQCVPICPDTGGDWFFYDFCREKGTTKTLRHDGHGFGTRFLRHGDYE